MDMNEIIARLQRGESMTDIADEMAAMLTQADHEYQKQLAEAEAAKKAEAHEIAKREAADKVAAAIYEYACLVDPVMAETDRLTGADVEEVMNQMLPLINSIKNIKVKPVKVRIKNADEAFSDFFKMFNL